MSSLRRGGGRPRRGGAGGGPARRPVEEVGVALVERVLVGGRPGVEAEPALPPDRESVDRLLTRRVLELGVDDLPVVQEDLALESPVGQVEDSGLPADADELN